MIVVVLDFPPPNHCVAEGFVIVVDDESVYVVRGFVNFVGLGWTIVVLEETKDRVISQLVIKGFETSETIAHLPSHLLNLLPKAR